ncbi:MAG TPA: ABC transporter permease [Methanomassiliicoccales archaeon]|nr:ABC transporter permease [Methanomassiliicoccales archaeon]
MGDHAILFFNHRSTAARMRFLFAIVDDYLIWILLVVSLLGMGLISRTFFSLQNLVNLLMNSTTLGILVIAESLCVILGKLDLSIESTLAFAALVGALMVKANAPPALAIIVVILIGVAVGAINGIFVVSLGVNPFMQTLSMNIILRGLMFVLTKGITVYGFPDGYRLFGDTSLLGVPTPILLLALLYALFLVLLHKRQWGRQMYAAGSNPRAAFLSGINVGRLNVLAFILAGALSAFAGLVISTRFDAVTNTLARGQVFDVFAAAVMGGIALSGGRGSLIGAVGGVLFLGCIASILTWLRVSPFGVQTVRGCVILLAIVLDALKNKLRERAL